MGVKKKIAILGQGQLANMLIESASELGLEITAFPLPQMDKYAQSTADEIKKYVKQLSGYDVVTYEIENISVDLLKSVQAVTQVLPSISALKVAQDRLLEKELFQKQQILTNTFYAVKSFEQLQQVVDKLSYPFIVKTRRFGYDGKGQYVIKTKQDLQKAWQILGEHPLIAEKFVKFDYEVSQVASRDQYGVIRYYPLVRNEHREGILRETHVMAFSESLTKQAQGCIKSLLEQFDYVGTFAIEFFVKDEMLIANEIAPRVHNSGHWTIDGANQSQFLAHMKAIAGMGLEEVKLKHPYTMMINLIAEDAPKDLPKQDGIYPKSYGKIYRENRKMGHINITADSQTEFYKRCKTVYNDVKAKPCLDKS